MISIWLLAFDGYMMCWLLDLDFDPHSNNATCTACHHLWIYDRTEMHLLLLGYHYHYRKTILYQIFTLYRLREMWHWPRDFTFDLFIIELDVILAKLASIICFLMIASILCHLKFLITTLSVFSSPAYSDCYRSCWQYCTHTCVNNVSDLCPGWRCIGVEQCWFDCEHNQLNIIWAVHWASQTTHWLCCQNQFSLSVNAALCLAVVYSTYILYVR